MATVTKISDQIFGKCSAALSVDSSYCDGITSANIAATLSTDLANIYKKTGTDQFRLMSLLLEAEFIGKSCFPRQFGIWDWIQATSKRAGPKRLTLTQVNGGLWELYPFVKMERKSPINNEYWTVSAGTATGAAPGTWKVTVTSQTGIPADVRWFPIGMRVAITGVASGGSSTVTQYQVAELPVVAGNTLVVKLASLNAGSFLPAAKREQPAIGVLYRQTPNVSDYEKYCPQIPGLNTKQLSPFFIETTRWSYAFCELFEKYLDAIRKDNPYFKTFGDVESVELNRQIQQDFERRSAWSFFFNKPLQYQNLQEYDQLETIAVAQGTITNPNGGAIVGRRAAATGVYELLAECGRVFDLQGQVLNLQEWFKALYVLQRVRQGNGLPGNMIEAWTDDNTAVQVQQAMVRYFSMRSEGLLRLNMDISARVEQGPFGFRYRVFQLDFPDVQLRILTHAFFNDMLQAATLAGSTLTTPARKIWMLDWSTIYEMVFEVNTVTLQSGDINRLAEIDYASYGCVMKLPRNRQKLMSKTYTNVVECPQSSMILENFSGDIPEHEGVSGAEGDYYGLYS